MDFILETPAKRQKVDLGGLVEGYGSAEDSGEELFEGYETIATLPLPINSHNQSSANNATSLSSPQHVTQPTQLLNQKPSPFFDSSRVSSVIQVAASSPLVKPTTQSPYSPIKKPGVSLASRIAPPGTAYRSPVVIPRSDSVVELSSDEDGPPIRRRDSSDEGSQSIRDIKPSNFIQPALNDARPADRDRFREITSQSFYKPFENSKSGVPVHATKRSADVMADAYGNARRPNNIRQIAPKAQPRTDITLDEIEDYQIRTKVERMHNILPATTIAVCKAALIRKKGNFDDAMDYLSTLEEKGATIDLTLSDRKQSLPNPPKPAAKQQLKAPAKSIQSKWASTQAFSQQPQASSPPLSDVAAPRPRKRLVQGRKNLSTSAVSRKSSPALGEESVMVDLNTESDSAIGSESDGQDLKCKVLGFLNSCTSDQFADIAAISNTIASSILSQRPFKNLDVVRNMSGDSKPNTKRRAARPIGDKIVDTCLDMWRGYDAVDELVRHCESLGKPVAEQIQQWGCDVHGASNDGELGLTNFDQKSEASLRDSGIGTPTSGPASPDVDGEVRVCPVKDRNSIFGQPQLMHEDVVLKDYQVVGVNWLALLYEKKLSCILADDMGLGKTCQVIAFLAHLFEQGNKGPHLVIVPGSTIENWLREFSVFCPKLAVMPYYGKSPSLPLEKHHLTRTLQPAKRKGRTFGIRLKKTWLTSMLS